jgi:hypothetical protein
MDMQTQNRDALVFHMTGQCAGDGVTTIDGLDLRPALLAPYRDLNALRHDFPLVLVDRGAGRDFACTLSSLVDAVLKDVAPRGIEGERLRRHALQLEQEIRRAVAAGASGSLAELWDHAAEQLGAREGETLEQVLAHAGTALRADGEVLGCTHDMPARLIRHAWEAANRAKARRFNTDLSRLVIKLSDILRAAFSHSQAGRQPQSLKSSVGGPHQNAFDFDALSRIVGKGAPRDELPPARRERLTRVLGVLEAQRYFAPADPDAPHDTFEHVFHNCAAAAQAFRERLPEALALIKALAIAELEVTGRYVEAEHDLYFASLDEYALTTDDLALLPDCLVCIPPDSNDAPENANLMEMLSSGLPVKVLVQTSDLLEDASIGTGHFAFGVRSARLATAATGLGGMFVLQSASANLHAMHAQIAQGLACRGPALFSVFAGSAQPASQLPPYLASAAAMQARAFPAFCYDAVAGGNWATRFSLANNPQPGADWASENLDYADLGLQRASEACAFTFADFVLCDARHASHFALVPRERWSANLLPAADWLALPEAEAASQVPYLLAVDGQDALQRVVVDARVMQAARRCLLLWRRLQEHGHVHDAPPAAAVLAAPAVATPAAAPTAATPAAAGPDAAAPAHSRDEAWIDTTRCPSCNECQLINDRLFGYDERKQAFIKDLKAGSYRQLVEAAESCQVAIIHPGAPSDPNEPGLADLLVRAEPFR